MCEWSHEYLIKGAPRVLKKVEREIGKFCSEYCDPDYARYGSRTRKNNDGTLSWLSYEDSLMVDLDNALESLTNRNATKIWAYHGEDNENYIYGCLFFMEKGRCKEVGFWNADVDFDAAMAAIELKQSASVDAALVILETLESACKEPGRLSAVLAEMLLTALDRHPSLDANEAIWTRIMAIKCQIEASDFMSQRTHNDDELDPNRASKLIATLEAKQLADGLAKPSGEVCPPKAVRL